MKDRKLNSWRADMIIDLVRQMNFSKWELAFLSGLLQGELDFYDSSYNVSSTKGDNCAFCELGKGLFNQKDYLCNSHSTNHAKTPLLEKGNTGSNPVARGKTLVSSSGKSTSSTKEDIFTCQECKGEIKLQGFKTPKGKNICYKCYQNKYYDKSTKSENEEKE